MKYKNKQIGTGMMVCMGIVFIIVCLPGLFLTGFTPLFFIVLFILGLISFLFYSLTIEVDENEVSWFFGNGFWQSKIKLNRIASTKSVKIKWYSGFGIRMTFTGTLYIVSGLRGVELTEKNGHKITLGTNDPQGLLEAIE